PRARELGAAGADRPAQPVHQLGDPGDAAPRARWPRAEGALRDPGRDAAATLRALHERPAGRRVRALRRAQASRGVRLPGFADPARRAPPQETGLALLIR